MREHKGRRLCISGIPTAGKSTLTQKLISEKGVIGVFMDDFREELANDERYRKWVNFYIDQDLETYYTTTTAEVQWRNLVNQSEALWPAFLEHMDSYAEEIRPVIFESVNLLPDLVKRDTGFPCVVLVGASYEETYERNIRDPRWGSTERELDLNSQSFFYVERPQYRNEAEKNGFPVFETSDDAYQTALEYLK